jgi:DNA repair exonuclease SbcCD ATPase subunit
MIIEKIVIKSFGAINDMTLEFSPKINVIEGQNEAGKSTIAAFIRYMLYGFDSSDNGECSERKKRISWSTGMAQGSMYVKVNGKRYLITRSTVASDNSPRPTYKEESSIIDLETGSPAFGKMNAGDVFFKVDSSLFDNTAFIGQIGDASFSEERVKESIENIIFSGNEKINNQRAITGISEKMEELIHQSGNGGAIYDLMKLESELEEKLETCNDDNRRILIKESELHKIRETRAAAENKLEKLRELDSCYRNVMLIQTFDELHKLEEDAEAKNEAYNSFIAANTKADFVPDENYLTDLAVARKGVNEAYHTLGEARESYAEQRGIVGITREIESAITLADEEGGENNILSRAAVFFKNIALGTSFTILGAIGVIAAIVLFVLAGENPTDIILPIVVGVASLALAGYFGFSLITNYKALKSLEKRFTTSTYKDLKGKLEVIREARTRRDTLASSVENAKLTLERAKERYEAQKNELIELILRWGEEPPTSDLNPFLDTLEEKVRTYLDEKNRLFDEKVNIEITVREIRRTLADKSEVDIRAQVSPLKRKALVGINHDGIIGGISEARAVIAEQDRLAFDAENELMLLKSRAGDPGEYYSRINSIATRREELRDRHKAYYIALRAIESASANLRRDISPRLGDYATGLMSVMTDKKYKAFAINNDLEVTFRAEDGDDKSVDFLSGGTRDLAYIAVRAALIDMLYKEKPPIIFDESFAHQDNIRARSMMKGIANLAKEGCQSFIFTCRSREGSIAKEILKSAGVYKLTVTDGE